MAVRDAKGENWIQVDVDLPEHPKIDAAGPEAAWLYVAALCYCGRNLTDGRVPRGVARRLTAVEDPAAAIAALISARLWVEDGDAYLIPDYTLHNRSRADVLTQREKDRSRKRRPGAVPASSRESTPDAVPDSDRIPDGIHPREVEGERDLPTTTISPTGREARVAAAVRVVVDREQAAAPAGSIHNPDGWRIRVAERVQRDHGSELHRLAHEHPDWAPDRLADEVLREQGANGAAVPSVAPPSLPEAADVVVGPVERPSRAAVDAALGSARSVLHKVPLS